MRILPTISAPNPTTASGAPTTTGGSGVPGPPGPPGPPGADGTTGTLYNETPSGTIDGSNATFTLSQAPIMFIEQDLNGQVLDSSVDYSVVGLTVTFTLTSLTGSAAPQPGDSIRSRYIA